VGEPAGFPVLYPILPIFRTVVLGAPASAVAAVEGTAEGGAALTKLGAGRLGDRYRRRAHRARLRTGGAG
jgi:hypothetical protein